MSWNKKKENNTYTTSTTKSLQQYIIKVVCAQQQTNTIALHKFFVDFIMRRTETKWFGCAEDREKKMNRSVERKLNKKKTTEKNTLKNHTIYMHHAQVYIYGMCTSYKLLESNNKQIYREPTAAIS